MSRERDMHVVHNEWEVWLGFNEPPAKLTGVKERCTRKLKRS
jgi:hypothetical protein